MKKQFYITILHLIFPALTLFVIVPSYSVAQNIMPTFSQVEFSGKPSQESIVVNIYLPKDYIEKPSEIDVLYVLDGQRLFYHYVSLQQTLQQFRLAPMFIVVGIETPYPKRFAKFQQFDDLYQIINNQVVRYMDNTYKTTNKHIIAGWEYGGAFAFRALLESDSPFDAAIASSPFPMKNATSAAFFKLPIQKQKQGLEKFLYIATGDHAEGSVLTQVTEFFAGISEVSAQVASNWIRKKWSNENHRSSFNDTFYYGTIAYYQGYQAMPLASIEDFNAQGGFDGVKNYYINRRAKYGKNEKIENETYWQIARYAMDADDIALFEQLFKRTSDTSFAANLSDSWKLTFADYFIKRRKFLAAKTLILPLSIKHTHDAEIISRLAQINSNLE